MEKGYQGNPGQKTPEMVMPNHASAHGNYDIQPANKKYPKNQKERDYRCTSKDYWSRTKTYLRYGRE
jgi:hypothetical protein